MKILLGCRKGKFRRDPLSPKHLHFDLEYANRRVLADQEWLKWNST